MKKIIHAVLILTMILGISNCLNAQNLSQMTEKNGITTVELTTFTLIEGVDETKFIEVAKQTQKTFLDKQEGFVKRTLVKGENGWTDIVYWESPQSMQNALAKAESSADLIPFIRMINFKSVKMNLSEIKIDTN